MLSVKGLEQDRSLFIFYISQDRQPRVGTAVLQSSEPKSLLFPSPPNTALYLQIAKIATEALSPHLHFRLQEEGMEEGSYGKSILFKESSQKGPHSISFCISMARM